MSLAATNVPRCPLSPCLDNNVLTSSAAPPPLDVPSLGKGEVLEGQDGGVRAACSARIFVASRHASRAPLTYNYYYTLYY